MKLSEFNFETIYFYSELQALMSFILKPTQVTKTHVYLAKGMLHNVIKKTNKQTIQ